MKFKKLITIAAVAAMTTTAVSAGGLFDKSEDAVEYRQKSFSLIRFQFSDIRNMLKGKTPYDQQQMELRAQNLAKLSSMPWEAFANSTAKGAIPEQTDALAAIWKDKADFDKRAKMFQKNANALVIAAKSGDKGAIKKAVGALGKSCKGCHDNYKD